MKYKFMLLSVLGIGFTNAQSTLAATGFDALSADGSASYTVGQIAYFSKGANNEITEGVQHPYEIITLAVSETDSREKNITLYPNPVKDVLFVDFNQESYENASYQLFDAQGTPVKQGKLSQKKNELDLSLLPQSVYIIRIIQENEAVKAFKIIKK